MTPYPCFSHRAQDEYFYYDNPVNGDIHEVVRGKMFAFRGDVLASPQYGPRCVGMRVTVSVSLTWRSD